MSKGGRGWASEQLGPLRPCGTGQPLPARQLQCIQRLMPWAIQPWGEVGEPQLFHMGRQAVVGTPACCPHCSWFSLYVATGTS